MVAVHIFRAIFFYVEPHLLCIQAIPYTRFACTTFGTCCTYSWYALRATEVSHTTPKKGGAHTRHSATALSYRFYRVDLAFCLT